MTVIRTTDDLLRALREHPEWKEAVRLEILGGELLSLPELVKENSRQIAEMGKRMDQLAERVAEMDLRLTARMDQLTERMDQLTARMDQLTERMDQLTARMDQLTERMDQLTARMDQLTEIVRQHDIRLQRVEARLGDLDGNMLENDVRARPRHYIRRAHMKAVRVLSDDEIDEILTSLAEEEQAELDRLDAILVGQRLDAQQAYVAVEASAKAEQTDLDRALRRAHLLSKATRTLTLPLVVSREAPDERILDRAKTLQVALSTKHDGLILEAPWITKTNTEDSAN